MFPPLLVLHGDVVSWRRGDSWVWVGPSTGKRACFDSPEWCGEGSSRRKRIVAKEDGAPLDWIIGVELSQSKKQWLLERLTTAKKCSSILKIICFYFDTSQNCNFSDVKRRLPTLGCGFLEESHIFWTNQRNRQRQILEIGVDVACEANKLANLRRSRMLHCFIFTLFCFLFFLFLKKNMFFRCSFFPFPCFMFSCFSFVVPFFHICFSICDFFSFLFLFFFFLSFFFLFFFVWLFSTKNAEKNVERFLLWKWRFSCENSIFGLGGQERRSYEWFISSWPELSFSSVFICFPFIFLFQMYFIANNSIRV